MRTYAHFDDHGVIAGLVIADAKARAELRMRPDPGMAFEEIKGLTIRDPRDINAVRKIAEGHRVRISRAPMALVKKR